MNKNILDFNNIKPKIDKDVFIAHNAVIIGDVKIGSGSTIWFGCVLRGDVAPIRIGNNTNIQDGTVIHTSRFNNGKVDIGDDVTVGHMCLLHACTIANNSFIGMRSTIMDKAIIGDRAFIGAGSLICERKNVNPREMWMGHPAKFRRMVTDMDIKMMKDNVYSYVNLSKSYR